MIRFRALVAVAGALVLAVLTTGPAAAAPAAVPSRVSPQEVSITIRGQSAEWNGMQGAYQYAPAFTVQGRLVIAESVNRSGYELGLVAGNWSRGVPGSVTFVSSSELAGELGGMRGDLPTAAVPVATVSTSGSTLTADVDANSARMLQINMFLPAPHTSVEAVVGSMPVQILDGLVTVRTSGSRVTGEIEFHASGYIEPGNGAFPTKLYKATFSS